MSKLSRLIGWLLVFAVVGSVSGRICGFIILFVADYTGHSGTTGSEYFGYQNLIFEWWWAGWIGQPLGAIAGPIAGFLAVASQTHLFKAWLFTMFGTLIGGCIGALSGPFEGLLFGCCGFVAGCLMMEARKGSQTIRQDSAPDLLA